MSNVVGKQKVCVYTKNGQIEGIKIGNHKINDVFAIAVRAKVDERQQIQVSLYAEDCEYIN